MPFRAETVGSLLRPPELKQAREDHAAGRLGAAEFKRIEDGAVDEAISLQEQAGLDAVTDGEMRRGHFTGPLSEAISGMDDVPAAPHDRHGPDELRYTHQRAVTGKLGRRRSLAQEEFVYARARATRPVKQTLPSPLMMQTFWSPEHSTAAYADPFEMFRDAADLLRDEIRDLVALGCEYVQIDAPELGEELLRRVEEASRFFPRDQLALSPQCGFASTVGGNPVPPETQERKFRLVSETARKAWP